MRLPSGRDADLLITGWLIQTLGDRLGCSTAIRRLPQSQWVTVHLDDDCAADTLPGLVSPALRAPAGGTGASTPPPCHLHHVTFPDRSEQHPQ
nr:hypothetical protein [Streptomyces sp. NWU339]